MKGKHVLIAFAFFLGDLCRKAGHRCSYPGQPEKQNSETHFCTQTRSCRVCFVLLLKRKDILNLTSDAQPSSVHPDMLMHRTCGNTAPAVLWFGLYRAELHCELSPMHFWSRCFVFWHFIDS